MRILVLLPRFPWPLDKGDKLRAYHQMVELSKRYEVYLFALSHNRVGEEQMRAMQPYCKEMHVECLRRAACCANVVLSFLKGQPLQLGYWTSTKARRAFKAFANKVQPDVVYCQMVRTIPTLGTRAALPAMSSPRKILDFQDALSLNTRRRMERSHGLLRLVLKYEYKALQRAEQEALRTFDATTVISAIDQTALAPEVALVPNGVDTNYFQGERLKVKGERYACATTDCGSHLSPFTSHLSPCSIVFCGNMSYAPNVDAARYLVEEIMPLVWSRIPSATVLLAGADPKPAVKALASDRVTVSGRLPDIREAYASAQLFVAPMRIGSGLQNKLLEAMSMSLPCVTTTIANAPLGATDGEQILVGDTTEALAAHIVSLLTDPSLCSRLAAAGHRFVHEHYSWPAAVAPLEQLLYAKLESK